MTKKKKQQKVDITDDQQLFPLRDLLLRLLFFAFIDGLLCFSVVDPLVSSSTLCPERKAANTTRNYYSVIKLEPCERIGVDWLSIMPISK